MEAQVHYSPWEAGLLNELELNQTPARSPLGHTCQLSAKDLMPVKGWGN